MVGERIMDPSCAGLEAEGALVGRWTRETGCALGRGGARGGVGPGEA
jgi:hypothetical protein